MRAISIREAGDADVLVYGKVERPKPGEGEVLVEVVAAGVNRADVQQRRGYYPPPPDASELPGLEVSGRIAALGPGTGDSPWSTGDEVCALLSGGGYAEYVRVPVGQLLSVPAGVDLADAAALPEVACTVWSNLSMEAGLSAGETVLLHGGSSGIGTMAVQVAKALGARVAVTAGSDAKLRACRELGADILINYREQDFVEELAAATGGAGADVILDVVGAAYLDRNIRALATGGRLVVIGMQGGAKAELNLARLVKKRASVHATSLRARPRAEKAGIVAAVCEHVWPLVEAGKVRPVIHRRFPLAEAAAAHRVIEESSHVGKVLLDVR